MNHAATGRSFPRPVLALLGAGCAALLYWSLTRGQSADFSVYWWGVHDYFINVRPMYGRDSGSGWPMIYRYPPLYMLLFYPLTHIPLRVAAGLWMLAQGGVVGITTLVAIRKWRLEYTALATLATVVLLTPHFIWSLKYGNVQWLVIAAIFLAMLIAETHPGWAGALLALAIAIKVWPAIFVPWFIRPGRRRALLATLAMSAIVWTMPAAAFGMARYRSLLHEWVAQEAGLGFSSAEIWYPSQSMRGVFLRYFTASGGAPADYPDIHIAEFSARTVVAVWVAVSVAVYAWVVWKAYRAVSRTVFLWDAAAFVVFSVFQPFCNKASLISLWPAILVAGHVLSTVPGRLTRVAVRTAIGIAVLEIVAQTRFLSRLFEMVGAEFYLMLALLTALIAGAANIGAANVNENRATALPPQRS